MAVGTGIESIRRAQELRKLNNANLPTGKRNVRAASVSASPSSVTYMGSEYPPFVLGVSDPEGTGDEQHIIP